MTVARQRVASRVHEIAKRNAINGRNVVRAEVSNLDPLTLVYGEEVSTLTVDDDFALSGWMRFYQREYGIALADDVLLHREGEDYVLFDVAPSHDLEAKKLVPQPFYTGNSLRSGPLNARGNATNWAGTSYLATDDRGGTTYLSDGTNWIVSARGPMADYDSNWTAVSLPTASPYFYDFTYGFTLTDVPSKIQLWFTPALPAAWWGPVEFQQMAYPSGSSSYGAPAKVRVQPTYLRVGFWSGGYVYTDYDSTAGWANGTFYTSGYYRVQVWK